MSRPRLWKHRLGQRTALKVAFFCDFQTSTVDKEDQTRSEHQEGGCEEGKESYRKLVRRNPFHGRSFIFGDELRKLTCIFDALSTRVSIKLHIDT